jgi:hypothetical protein
MTTTSTDLNRRRASAARSGRAVRTHLTIFVSALVLVSVMGSDAASARTRYVIPRNVTMDASTSAYRAAGYVYRPIGILTRVGAITMSPAALDSGTCDVGDSPRIC